MWGVLPKAESHWYPSVLHMSRDVFLRWVAWMGEDFEAAWEAHPGRARGWSTFSRGTVTVRVALGEDLTMRVEMRPLTMTADFLSVLVQSEGRQIRLAADLMQTPYQTDSDKLSQIEFYFALESTARHRRTICCGRQEGRWSARQEGRGVLPLSGHRQGTRVLLWWCTGCGWWTRVEPVPLPLLPAQFRILGERKFDGRAFLAGPISLHDMTFMLAHLPKRKAAGQDDIPYEVWKEAPDTLFELLLAAVNELLAGNPLPESWKGGGDSTAHQKRTGLSD